MTRCKKFSALVALMVFTALIPASLFAIPGIITDTPDASGQYIFYRDSTYEKETYIGFLSYDESTIAVRVFSEDTDITTYIRLDPAADFISIIGESFPDYLTDSQIETINYAHDMLYEFASRRKHLNGIDLTNDLIVTQDVVQFGGTVSLCWQFYMPLFNLRSVTSEDGEMLFEAVTMGILENSDDTAFQDFNGFSDVPPSLLAARKIPAADKAIDDQWVDTIYSYVRSIADEPVMHAAVTMGSPSGSQSFMKEQAANFLQSMGGSYVYLPNSTLTFSDEGLYSKVLYAPENDDGKWSCAIRKIKPLDELNFSYQELNCYSDYYRQHSAYLEDLIVRWDDILQDQFTAALSER